MKVLAKTTGSFIVPLGGGEFVFPDFSEVEDCALLRSEVFGGRVVIAEEAPFDEVAEAPVVKEDAVVEERPNRVRKRGK